MGGGPSAPAPLPRRRLGYRGRIRPSPHPRGREFDLWLVGDDGAGLERVTYTEGFDGFPMWAPDGETFVFCSNRRQSAPGETNVFVTKWVD